MNFILFILKKFTKTEDKLILFNCFGGKKYDDSPKVVFEKMRDDKRFDDYHMVWAFHQPQNFRVEGAEIIKSDTFTYYKTALKARCWITNSGIERALNFKGKNTFCFNTWHGTPLKKMGTDISKTNRAFKRKKNKSKSDVMTAQSDFEADIFSRVFNIERNKFLLCGLPRNDELTTYTEDDVRQIKLNLNISPEKKVVLYAPTFREYARDVWKNCVMIPPVDFNKWEEKLGDEYCLLFRAHYEVSKIMDIKENDFLKNVTDYPSLNELMLVSDMLISDYSSIYFDFSIMDKVMLHFTYDYDEYAEKRGMYFDIRDYLNGSNNEDDLIQIIKNINYSDEIKKTQMFRDKYVNYYGNAAKASVDCIYKNITR